MAKSFSEAQWQKIHKELDTNGARYGLPDRVYGSVVLGSFNIRKLGAERKRSAATWKFLGKICSRFDLLAVQEVMDDLSGLQRLQEEMGPEYHLIVSDTTGAFPGMRGLNERLAFVYRDSFVRRAHIVSDVTYDRSKVLDMLARNAGQVRAALDKYDTDQERFKQKKTKKKPKFDLPFFLSFIRQPYAVTFRIHGHPGVRPYEIMAINAHLIYGEMKDRKQEFNALMDWIVGREEESKEGDFPGVVLLGDLNLDFDDPEADIGDINKYLKGFKTKGGEEVRALFPFLDKHPQQKGVFRTNARMKQTFDQIGVFYWKSRIPEPIVAREMGSDPRGPDYGVVNFVNLFAAALGKKSVSAMNKEEKKGFYELFEHSVSDHMPIWLRFPLPDG